MDAIEGSVIPKWEDVTYRDWLAATCLTSLLTKYGSPNPVVSQIAGNPYQEIASAAYKYADAFLQIRNMR